MRSKRFTRGGLLTPWDARVLRARSVMLRAGAVMEWHTTGAREELLIAIAGAVEVETEGGGRRRRRRLLGGACCFLPQETVHRVVNRSRRLAHYLYVTAPRTSMRAHATSSR